MGKAIDQPAFVKGSKGKLRLYLIGAGTLFIVGSLASWIRVYCLGTAEDRISNRLRRLLFDSYMDKDVEFFEDTASGDLVATLSEDVNLASATITDVLPSGLRSWNSGVNGSIVLLYTSPTRTAVSLGIYPSQLSYNTCRVLIIEGNVH